MPMTLSSTTCAKCGAVNALVPARIIDRSDTGPGDLAVRIEGAQHLSFLATQQEFALKAWVCLQCGYCELYLAHPEEARAGREKH